ncbi:MAG: HDOD domain-containing protein [Acidobacteriota bacterium]
MTEGLPLLQQIGDFAERHGVTLPVVSPVAIGLMAAVERDDVVPADVEAVVQADQVLTAGVLRASNSAFYGGLSPVTTVRAAIQRLGLVQVARLVVLASERNRYTARQPLLRVMMTRLWAHASACGQAAEWLARRLGHRSFEQEAFVGGLMHDIGKLYLIRVLDEMVATSDRPLATPEQFLLELLNVAHADQGHRLVSGWNLPSLYCGIVRDHHSEDPPATDVPQLLVRMANRSCHKLGIGLKSEPSLVLAVLPEAAMLMAGEVLLAELEVLLEDTASQLKTRAA